MAVALGGLDTVAFTGGVGEGSSDVRDRVCELLGFLGDFDVVVVPAREELVIARAVRRSARRLEAETDVGARLPLDDPPGDVSHAHHPDRPLVHDHGEMMNSRGRASAEAPSSSDASAGAAIGSAVIHSRARASLEWTRPGERTHEIP